MCWNPLRKCMEVPQFLNKLQSILMIKSFKNLALFLLSYSFSGKMSKADDSYDYLNSFGSYGVEEPQSYPLSALNEDETQETGSLVSIKVSCFEVISNSPICDFIGMEKKSP